MKRVVLWVCALMMTLLRRLVLRERIRRISRLSRRRGGARARGQPCWPDYEFEDYCEVRGTPKGDYGFALVHRKNGGFSWAIIKVDGEMKYWLKNAGAVPQGKEEAWFGVGTAGWEEETDWVRNSTADRFTTTACVFP